MNDEPKSFWGELKARRVVRVAVMYAIVAWVVIQIAQTVAEILLLPPWAAQTVLVLVTLGFPVALVLAWAFQVTPEGVKRTESTPDQSRLPFVAGIAVGTFAAAAVAYIVFGSDRPAPPGTPAEQLNPNSVAVLPFRASTPDDLSYLGGGVMDLLSARLDGEVGPRSIDPSTVAAAAQRAEAGAAAVARSLGAGLLITGSVVGDASRIVLSAEMANAEDGAIQASASAEGHPDSLTSMIDGVVGQLLSLSIGEYPESVSFLTSTSPQALRAYLKGREAWRRGDYIAAVDFMDGSIDFDSTFALAALAKFDVASMALEDAGGALALAGRHRDRLGSRDRTYLEARLPAVPRSSRETIETYEQLTRDLPDRVEAWYVLGDSRMHSPLDPGPDWDAQTRAAFELALELDPNHFPAAQHLTFFEFMHGSPDELQAAMLRLRELSPSSVHPFHRGLEEGTGLLTLDVDAIPSYSQISLALAAGVHLETLDQAPEDFLPFVETAVAERRRRAVDGRELRAALIAEYRVELTLGRSGRAQVARERLIREFREPRLGMSAIDEALWSVGSVEDGEASVAAIDERLQSGSPESLGAGDVAELANAEIWRFVRDSEYRGRGAEARIFQAMPGFEHPERLQVEAYARALEAWSRTRAGLPAAAESVERVEEILLQQVVNQRLLLAMASIHEERGEYDQALRMLDRRVRFSGFVSPYEVTYWREEGRVAAQAGDTVRAVRAYERYLKVRRNADALIAPEVDSVRAALVRLDGG